MKKTVLFVLFCAISSVSAIFAQNEREEGDAFAAAGNYRGAAVMYRICAESNEDCMIKLINLIYENKVETQFTGELFQLIQPLAQKGNKDALYFLGLMYRNGIGGATKDDAEAAKWLLLSAAQDHIAAQNELAAMKREGDLRADAGNYVEAAAMYRLFIASDDQCVLKLFKLIYHERIKPQSPDELFQLISPLADKENAEAQYYLGMLYLNGLGSVDKDEEQASAWLLKSARQNYVFAQRELDGLKKAPEVPTNAVSIKAPKDYTGISKILMIAGGVAAVAGAAGTYALPPQVSEDWSNSNTTGTYFEVKKRNPVFLIAGCVVGGVCIGTGIILKKKSTTTPNSLSFEHSDQPYRNQSAYAHLNIVAVANGAGLRLTF